MDRRTLLPDPRMPEDHHNVTALFFSRSEKHPCQLSCVKRAQCSQGLQGDVLVGVKDRQPGSCCHLPSDMLTPSSHSSLPLKPVTALLRLV